MLSGYDRPGWYLVDHPNAKKQIAKRVAAISCVALMLPATASAITKNPGQCCAGQYRAPHGNVVVTR